MTFQQLRYLLEVNHTGSISKAAANLFVTRPSVSFSISSLEAELGYPIFIRTQQGLIPSPQGGLVIEYAKRICETQQLITNISKENRKHIEIATLSYQPVNNAIMRILEETKDRTDVNFTFNAHNGKAYHKLSLFEVDCALRAPFTVSMNRVQERITSRNLYWKELKTIPVYICIGPGHPLYSKEDVTPQDFAPYTLLDTPMRELSRSTFLKDIIKFNGKNAIASFHPAINYEILQKGLAYKICRRPTNQTIQQYGIRCIPIDGVSQQLLFATNPMRPLAPEVSRFLSLVEEELEIFDNANLL